MKDDISDVDASRQQEILDLLLQARVTKEKAVDTLTNEGEEPEIPQLDFEPI